jgi:alpha-tubulin suppressor-like RCC1 family protein
MRRFWSFLMAVGLLAGLLGVLPSGATVAAAAPKPPITATPAAPVRAEKFTVSGKLASRVVRPVVLQIKAGKKWKTAATGKTTKTGRFNLTSSTTSATATVRVVAKKVKVKGKKYAAVTTKTRTIKTTTQSASLSMPTSAQINEGVNANLAFTPARTGRPVQLEALIGGQWTRIGTGFETATGKALIQLTATTAGTYSYRGVAPAWNGAAAVVSNTAQLTITASKVTTPDPGTNNPSALVTHPITSTEASTVTSYDPAAGTIIFANAPTSVTSLVAGGAVTLPPRDGAPSGALRKVTGVTTSGATTTITTTEASLPEVIEDIPDDATDIGLSVLSSSFTPEDGVTATSLPSRSVAIRAAGLRAASVGELKLQVSKKWENADKSATADVSGSISVAPVIDTSLNIDWFKLKGYKFGAGIQAANDLKAVLAYKASAGQKYPLGTLKQVWAGTIGVVPIWVEANFQIYVSWTVSGSIELTAEVTQTGKISAGITNTSGDDLAPKLYTTTAAANSTLADLKASGEVGVFAGAEANLMLYSLAGPFATLGAEADATIKGNLTAGFTCKVVYGPHAEAGLKTSDAIKALTGQTYTLSAQLIKPTTTNNLCPAGTPTPPAPDPLAVATTSLPSATVNAAYSATLAASGGTGPYTWSATGLPAGISLDAATGALSGTPSLAGPYAPTITVTDSVNKQATATLTLTVNNVGNQTTAIAVTAGGGHTCALTSAGGVKCWGYNGEGELGDGTTTNRSSPVDVVGLTSGVTAVTAGGGHTCVLTSAGAVKCWGYNGVGALGDGTTVDSDVPVQVSGLASGVTAITAGGSHTCAITSGGALKCWGAKWDGSLGGGTIDSSVPAGVSGLASGVTAITVGHGHACAVTSGGTVKCWGANQYGQLGDGTTSPSEVPVEVSGLPSGVTAVAAGSWHNCAITSAGAVQCWGYNGDGGLGDGSTSLGAVPSPVQASGLTSGVTTIAAGWAHTCAVTSGAAKCWGYNYGGQLGNGTTSNSAVSVQVTGLTSGVTAITAGGDHTCALTNNGGVKCWGTNGVGELGDGTTTNRSSPVDVVGFGG